MAPHRSTANQRGRGVFAAGALAFVVGMLTMLFGLSANPAAAATTAPSSTTGTLTASGRTTATYGNEGGSCGDVCKDIPWCNGGTANNSPRVATDGYKGECVEQPVLTYECCTPNDAGTASVVILANNPNGFRLKLRVWLDNGSAIVKWVSGGATKRFVFADIKNGQHMVHVAVWAGGDTWCEVCGQTITVVCASPSPSVSPKPSCPCESPSASVSPSASATSVSPKPSVSTSPVVYVSPSASRTTIVTVGNTLPVTGGKVSWLVTAGLVLVGGGIVVMLASRRRRRVVTTTE